MPYMPDAAFSTLGVPASAGYFGRREYRRSNFGEPLRLPALRRAAIWDATAGLTTR